MYEIYKTKGKEDPKTYIYSETFSVNNTKE